MIIFRHNLNHVKMPFAHNYNSSSARKKEEKRYITKLSDAILHLPTLDIENSGTSKIEGVYKNKVKRNCVKTG